MALAEGLRAAKGETDPDYLQALYASIRNVRAPNVLQAAAEVSRDKTASVASRATAMLVLLSQFDNRLMPSLRKPWNELISRPIGEGCPFAPVVAEYAARSQLPADSHSVIAATFDGIRKDTGESKTLRDLAQCMRTLMRTEVPIVIDPKAIRLEYLCGKRFQAHNASDEWVAVSFQVDSSTNRGDLNIPPGGKVAFTAREHGTMRLFYRGGMVQSVRNLKKPCS